MKSCDYSSLGLLLQMSHCRWVVVFHSSLEQCLDYHVRVCFACDTRRLTKLLQMRVPMFKQIPKLRFVFRRRIRLGRMTGHALWMSCFQSKAVFDGTPVTFCQHVLTNNEKRKGGLVHLGYKINKQRNPKVDAIWDNKGNLQVIRHSKRIKVFVWDYVLCQTTEKIIN